MLGAMNFRSEPFGINNLATQEKMFHFEDESLSYSSYTFADIPTILPRSYLGDPVKFRLIHGGGEVFHSHHPHGGSIRWTRSPKREVQIENMITAAYDGPVKYPVVRTTTDRVDVEVIGPAEALDLETGSHQALEGWGDEVRNLRRLPWIAITESCESSVCRPAVGPGPAHNRVLTHGSSGDPAAPATWI